MFNNSQNYDKELELIDISIVNLQFRYIDFNSMLNIFAKRIEKKTVVENLVKEMLKKEKIIDEYKIYIDSLDKSNSSTSVYNLDKISPRTMELSPV